MNELIPRLLACIPAAAAPAVIFAAVVGALEAAFIPFFVALGHALFFGLPLTSLLMHSGHYRLFPVLIAGAVVGVLPAAIFFLPATGSVAASDVAFLAKSAGLGAAGGVSYYTALRAMRPNSSFKPTSLRDAA
jgi:hypothetical protein